MRPGPVDARFGRWRLRAPSAGVVTSWALVAFVFVVVLPASVSSPLVGIAGAGVLGLVVLVAALGAERASTAVLVLAFFFAPLTNFSLGRKPLVFASALFVLAFGLALPRLIQRPLRLPAKFVVGSLLFTVMGFLAAPLAISAPTSITYISIAVVALVLIPMATVWMAPNERQMFAMALAFGLGTAASTLYGLPKHDYRNYGFTYHPVALGYTAMLTLSFVPFLLTSKVRGRWLLVPPVALIALVGVWTSGSRTGLLVLAALAVVVPVIERSLKLGWLVATGFVVLIPFVVTYDPSGGSTSALSRLFGSGGAENSDTTRLSTLRDALDQIHASPILGNGYSVEHTYVIHDLYLQVLAAEGAIGLIGLLLMLAAFVSALTKAPAPQRCLAYPALAVILAGPFQPNMGDHYLGMSLGLSLVAAVGVMTGRQSDSDRASGTGSPPGVEVPRSAAV